MQSGKFYVGSVTITVHLLQKHYTLHTQFHQGRSR